MIAPSKSRFLEALRTHEVVSLTEELILDAETPISILARFQDRDSVLLEGISEKVRNDRFSYLAFDPHLRLEVGKDSLLLTDAEGKTTEIKRNVYDYLKEFLAGHRAFDEKGRPFLAGLVGYLGYECHAFLEDVPVSAHRDLGMPLGYFIVPRSMIIIDNLARKATVVRNVFKGAGATAPEALYEEGKRKLEELLAAMAKPLAEGVPPLRIREGSPEQVPFETNVSKEAFMERAARCKAYIKAGDIFQVQVSRRRKVATQASPFNLYRHLRHINPSPFLYLIRFKDFHIIGASPEILVNAEDGTMVIRPLAGTRKRQSQTQSEQEIIDELTHDEKEKAEHIMLVDLARNDIARACKTGSIRVTELMALERYSHVIHMVSHVEGKLKDGCNGVDALKYGFPAGTVTGAPKIRAMEIIHEMEGCAREFYGGGVLFLDFHGNLKSALTIRTMVVKNGAAWTQAAAGIVADSVLENEYQETENKMRACFTVMANTL